MQEGATKYNVVYVKILHHPQRSSVVQNAFKCLNITCQTYEKYHTNCNSGAFWCAIKSIKFQRTIHWFAIKVHHIKPGAMQGRVGGGALMDRAPADQTVKC